ncbi:hypothetical protein GCM10028798_13610 [Humibacter antri]
MNELTRVLHTLTHRVPGVPEHSPNADPKSAAATRRPHGHHQGRSLHSPNGHHQNPPRVLVAWQNRIARIVHADR